ncbi:MAG TPA: TetR family transcriptional regulator [Burkholderiaceae bacterium]|nr:TetR family transcriptional regulator [Burkholderiaceae bacterium]
MVRRTKADALATRDKLLDTAELLFGERGVSRTSLNDIAVAAGTTRGAIYWHFKDKAALFNAMMERVTLPLEEALNNAAQPPADGIPTAPLARMRVAFLNALHKTVHDAQTRRVFDIATHKVEYVEEMLDVRDRHLKARDDCVAMTRAGLLQAARLSDVKLPMPAIMAAHGLHALIDGLIQNWLLAPESFNLEAAGRQTFDAYIAGLGFKGADAR